MIDISDALNPKGRFIHSYVKDRLIVSHTVRDIKITFSTKEPIIEVPEIDDILPKEAITLISESGYGLLSMTYGTTNIRCKKGSTIYFFLNREIITDDYLIDGRSVVADIESTADTLLYILMSGETYTGTYGIKYWLGQKNGLSARAITRPNWL